MRLRVPKISHQGLILIAVPLLCEFTFVGILAILLENASSETQREAHAREVLDHVTSISRRSIDAGSALGDYTLTGQRSAVDVYNHSLAEIRDEFDQLKRLVRNDNREAESIRRAEELTNRQISLLEQMYDMLGKGRHLEALKLMARLQGLRQQLRPAFDTVQEPYRIVQINSVADRARTRDHIVWVLVGGLLLSLVVAVALARYFAISTTKRLGALMQNTLNMASGAPLLPPLEGDDEIAHLDRVFNEMASARQEVQRLKREFVAMVSHELRTPLSSIQTFLGVLAMGTYGDVSDTLQRKLVIADRNIERLMLLINDLLDIEKLESKELELDKGGVLPNSVIESALDSVRSFAERHEVTLEVERYSGQAKLRANGDLIIQVLINLLSNAVKFSPAGTKVSVSCLETSDNIRFQVTDHGRGIPASFKERIFKRFEQASKTDAKEKKGSGLGLAICQSIVHKHGGTIGVDSEEGIGSSFWFTIPLMEQ